MVDFRLLSLSLRACRQLLQLPIGGGANQYWLGASPRELLAEEREDPFEQYELEKFAVQLIEEEQR